MMHNYSQNCEYIRNTFGLQQSASIYEVVSVITEAYKKLLDKPMAEAKTEGEVQCPTKKAKRTKKS